MGEGASKELIDMVMPRFNMNGLSPPGRKVGLLDEHHLWCYICDPFKHLWRYKINVEGDVPLHVKNMIAFYVPNTEVDYEATRQRISNEYTVSFSSVFRVLLGAFTTAINCINSPDSLSCIVSIGISRSVWKMDAHVHRGTP